MSYIPSKTKKDVLAELITVLLIVVLSVATKAWGDEFNKPLFDSQVKSTHLQEQSVQDAYNSITNVRSKFDEIVRYETPEHAALFRSHIDEICENCVGYTTLRLLLANMIAKGETLAIISSSMGDRFRPKNKRRLMDDILINTYDPSDRQRLCGINNCHELVPHSISMADALFHELCHAYHYKSGMYRHGQNTIRLLTSISERDTSLGHEIQSF